VRVNPDCEVLHVADEFCQTDLCTEVREQDTDPHKQAGHCSQCSVLEIGFNELMSLLDIVGATVAKKVSHFVPCHEYKYICRSVLLRATL
jgi:hypothetical protein